MKHRHTCRQKHPYKEKENRCSNGMKIFCTLRLMFFCNEMCVYFWLCDPPQGLSSYMEFFLSKDMWFSSSRTHADYSQTCENTSCLTWTLEFLLCSGKVQESALYRVPRCWCGSPGDTLQVTVRLHNSYPTGDSEIIPQAYTQCCRWIFNMGGPIRMQ